MPDAYSTPKPDPRKAAAEVSAETPITPRVKPTKPYPDFPLRAHATGYWCKKIRGRVYYFGRWEDPDGALQKYLDQKDDLHAGRTPRAAHDAFTVKAAVNAFLNEKNARVDAGELGKRTLAEYRESAVQVIAAFGKHRRVADLGPEDFAALRKKMAQRWGHVRLGNMIQSVRSVFKFAFESDLIDRPMRFGPGFKKPSKKVLRIHRAQQGVKLFRREEIRKLLDSTGVQLRAMILLGINAGLGNTDCGRLSLSALDLDSGWLDYPRPKTGIQRRCPLWPETVQAIREALSRRPEPKDPANAGLLFITKYGDAWAQTAITHEMSKLLRTLGINGHRNFYTLRHTFRTEADEAKDQPAIDHIMGHARDDMASVYRERISDERLRAVSQHVWEWLFAEPQVEAPAEQSPRIPPMERLA